MIKRFILFIIFSVNVQSAELNIDNLPTLLTTFLTELSSQGMLQDQDIPKLNNLLSQTKNSHQNIDKYLIKNIISQGASNPKKLNILDQKLFDLLKSKIDSIPSSRVFTKFLYNSFLVDLRNMITDPEYKNFLQYQKYKTQSLERPTSKMRLKYSYISPWIRLIIEESQDDFFKKLDFYNIDTFNYLNNLLTTFSKFENFKDFKITKYISIIDTNLKKAQEELDALSFEIAPSPDPNYSPPEKLPSAVTDWEPVDEEIIENGIPLTRDQLFPEPDPNYIPPKILPKAVDKWQ